MRDSALRLQDKTILVVGPFNGVTQAILRAFTEFGADVGLVTEPLVTKPGFAHPQQHAGRYVDGLNEAREVHPEYGRAVHYGLPLGDEKQVQEALGRVAESLGRMDALVDASPLSWGPSTQAEKALNLSRILAERLIPFLLAKQRGRLVYLYEDPCLDVLNGPRPDESCRHQLRVMIEELAHRHRGQNVTANALALGVTDDFLLKLFPQGTSLKRQLEDLQKSHPGLKLVDFHDVALGTCYLASALSASLTGQVLRLTHGYHLATLSHAADV